MTIEQIRELALHLGMCNIFTCSLDMDYKYFFEVQKTMNEMTSSAITVLSKNTDNPNMPPSICIQVYRVKMLFRCMNIKFEG